MLLYELLFHPCFLFLFFFRQCTNHTRSWNYLSPAMCFDFKSHWAQVVEGLLIDLLLINILLFCLKLLFSETNWRKWLGVAIKYGQNLFVTHHSKRRNYCDSGNYVTNWYLQSSILVNNNHFKLFLSASLTSGPINNHFNYCLSVTFIYQISCIFQVLALIGPWIPNNAVRIFTFCFLSMSHLLVVRLRYTWYIGHLDSWKLKEYYYILWYYQLPSHAVQLVFSGHQ